MSLQSTQAEFLWLFSDVDLLTFIKKFHFPTLPIIAEADPSAKPQKTLLALRDIADDILSYCVSLDGADIRRMLASRTIISASCSLSSTKHLFELYDDLFFVYIGESGCEAVSRCA